MRGLKARAIADVQGVQHVGSMRAGGGARVVADAQGVRRGVGARHALAMQQRTGGIECAHDGRHTPMQARRDWKLREKSVRARDGGSEGRTLGSARAHLSRHLPDQNSVGADGLTRRWDPSLSRMGASVRCHAGMRARGGHKLGSCGDRVRGQKRKGGRHVLIEHQRM